MSISIVDYTYKVTSEHSVPEVDVLEAGKRSKDLGDFDKNQTVVDRQLHGPTEFSWAH